MAVRLRMPLNRKITVLFGGAVLLTIAATLALPWVLLDTLTDRALVIRAEQIATLARQVVRHPGSAEIVWLQTQERLRTVWGELQRDLPSDMEYEPPRLWSVDQMLNRNASGDEGFLREAAERLSGNTQQSYWRFQDDGRLLRLAWAIRAPDTSADEGRLLGAVDVKLVVPVRERRWILFVTALGGGAGAVLAIIVFYTVTQRVVLMPLTRLRELTERVTSGDLHARSDLRTGDEFQKLGAAFNAMLDHIEKAQDELRRINRSLDIRLGELAETNVALYESNRLKSDFLSNVSHELRTPLVSIIGFADLLNDAWAHEDIDRARLARYTRNILTSGRSLLDLINDLLDLAKIEAGKMELHISEFDLAATCFDLIDFIRPLASKKELELRADVAPDLPRMMGDSGRVKQILYNLLSNAVKFTPQGGRVRLSADLDSEGQVVLRVSDTGPGIPQDKLHLIFEKFRQLDSSRTREYEGTGLGLAITRELVKLLQGQIEVRTEVGKGTEFIVRLPLRLMTPAAGASAGPS